MKKIAFLFPGQGAQYVGMGKEFSEAFSCSRETFEEADEILQESLSKIVFHGPSDILTMTKNSQTAIYVTSVALLRSIQRQFPDVSPSFCAGLSLGEYSALTAAGKGTFAKILPLVQSRGRYMHEACEATRGGMAAVIGLDGDGVEAMVAHMNLPHDLWVANYNTPGQVVVSGTVKGIESAVERAKEFGARKVIPLQVHGAFHSGLMNKAQERLTPDILAMDFLESPTKFIMNVTGDFVEDVVSMRTNLIKQVTSPVRWEQSISALERTGVDLYVEIGCGKTLTAMNRRIGVAAPTISIDSIADLETLSHALME